MTPRLLFRWAILWLICGAVMRAFFLLHYSADISLIGATTFLIGAVNDLMAFALVIAILCVVSLLHRVLIPYIYCLLVAVSLVVIVAEVFFWLEFEGRLDRLIFHYLAYPKEVVVFLEDQFLLSLYFLPFVAVCALVVWVIGWPRKDDYSPILLLMGSVPGVCVLLFLQPIVPASYQHSRIASEFISNGYLEVMVAAFYKNDDIAWLKRAGSAGLPLEVPDIFEPIANSALGSTGLGGSTQPAIDALSTKELSTAELSTAELPTAQQPAQQNSVVENLQKVKQVLQQKKHVVLIVEESFAGSVWADQSLRQKYLPNFVQLEAESLSFINAFATGSRTTRGLEAILNGFPPLPGIATTQRAGYQRLPSLARHMQDNNFFTAFLYGGWPGFSNFSRYWRDMGFEKIWTREDFSEDFETSWGVSDGALMQRIVAELDQLTQQHDRVFLSTLTVSHHRPYDFPEDAVNWSSKERSSAHAMAYADHSLGEFFRLAKRTAWYADSVFVVVADHGLHPRGDALIPIGSYKIPLVIHAQGLPPMALNGFGSNLNIAKTLSDGMALKSREEFYGHSLLCDCNTPVPVEYGYHIGLLQPHRLDVVSSAGKHFVWRYNALDNLLSEGKMAENPLAGKHRQAVIEYFAPAYNWFYPHSAASD